MFNNMLIRKKILLSTLALSIMLALLVFCSVHGVYAYRGLTINVGKLSAEFTRIDTLRQGFEDLRDGSSSLHIQLSERQQSIGPSFSAEVKEVLSQLEAHKNRIEAQRAASDPLLATTDNELDLIDDALNELQTIDDMADKMALGISNPELSAAVNKKIAELSITMRSLFRSLTDRMERLRDQTRLSYRTWIAGISFSAITSAVIVLWTFWFFRHSIVKPFKQLLEETKMIADGKFEHRIELKSKDELEQLATSMNNITDRFVSIRDNLNEQVQERTREVVRSEQLASVGFLAAGVAHEINNPLASIAWSAEALESRLHEILHSTPHNTSTAPAELDEEQLDILRDYLKRIQDEAFRCKGITERLLDFSRLGESSQRQETDIHEAVGDVCELVKHLGQYRNRTVRYSGTPGLLAWVSPTEFKQVVLNLLTNALDACDEGKAVTVQLEAFSDSFQLVVRDNGCGMTEEVLKDLFEPFFTRRRDGRGTGLGLSISYRIVQDHGGTLVPTSDGPNCGSTMKLTIPIHPPVSETYDVKQAA